MTSKSPTESRDSPVDDDRISYLCGQWVPHHRMQLSVDDIGFRQGVTAVERLRTYSGRTFELDAHLERWQDSTEHLKIGRLPSAEITTAHLRELINRNQAFVSVEGDVGITMFATPGVSVGDAPTFGMHLNRLDHPLIAQRRREGQPLVVTNVRQPGPDCWPRAVKMRSRIHYHLADMIARHLHEDAVGILLDDDDSITETSIANIAMVRSGQIVSPPADRVLAGITQSVVERLAADLSIQWIKRAIPESQLKAADEVLLMGTDGGLWFASSIDGSPIAEGRPGNLYQRLRERFERYVRDATTHSVAST